MAAISQHGKLDAQQHQLLSEIFTATLTHNVAYQLPTGPVTPANKIPYGVVIVDDAGRGLQTIVGSSWSIDGSNIPSITVQLQSGAGTLVCVVHVLYKVGP
jgi:hypothetical protein